MLHNTENTWSKKRNRQQAKQFTSPIDSYRKFESYATVYALLAQMISKCARRALMMDLFLLENQLFAQMHPSKSLKFRLSSPLNCILTFLSNWNPAASNHGRNKLIYC